MSGSHVCCCIDSLVPGAHKVVEFGRLSLQILKTIGDGLRRSCKTADRGLAGWGRYLSTCSVGGMRVGHGRQAGTFSSYL